MFDSMVHNFSTNAHTSKALNLAVNVSMPLPCLL